MLFFSRALHLDPRLVRGAWVGTGSCWHAPPPHCGTYRAPPFRATKSLLVTEHQASGQTVGTGQQPGFPLPQVDFYALRAEAYIQLGDFSSAIQNLRRAISFQPENTDYLERLSFVLYLQVPGLPPQDHARHPSHPACWLSSSSGSFPCSWDQL